MKNWVLHFTFLIKLETCFLVLLCLSSAGYASQSSADVHFCLPLDLREPDSLYVARKHALNLNVGEPRTVRMIYFLPNDRPFRQEVVDSMKVTIRQIQTFYSEQMQANGYGNKTFRFETDAQGEPMVHRVDGQHPDSHYLDNTFFTVLDEIEQVFDLDVNIYFVVIDNSTDLLAGGVLGRGGRRGKTGGMGLFPGGFSWTTAAHELGHAFGLEHDFHDDRYLMSYGPGQDRLSMCHAEFLVVHPYFNSNVEVQETPSPTIELISPLGYPSGSKSIAIQLKVSDSGGIHQVIISAKTIPLHRAAGFREVKACRGLNGEQDAVVEFDYDGIIPSNGFTNLSRPAEHPISVRVIDIDGNVSRISFDLWEISPHYIATLLGHTEYVGSVVFSPDGMILASGSGDHTIRLWDVSTRTEVATLIGHTEGVSSIAFSPDGTILASGSWDHTIKLWDMTIRRNVATLEGYTGVSVSFSYDGTMLASGSWQNIQLWDVSTRTEITTLKGHTGWVFSVAFSPDGMLLASGSDDGTIKLWDVSTRTEITTLKG
ncbi:MAG: hypothetical protein OXL96_03590, partial [Candidatus Poribacteria bacterium]|nr:hypothetical protein [Candidatus Poribacteria bacterium]